MKNLVLSILKPVLFVWLRTMAQRLKPLFVAEDEGLKLVLKAKDFHLAIYSHPSIVFGEKKNALGKVRCLNWKISFLRKCIKTGILKDERGHKLMRELGIQPYFGNGVEFWFEEFHSPIKPYQLPEVEKPQGRLAVYTALTGDYDEVHEILYKENDIDYILFTNNPSVKSKTWQVVLLESDLDDVLLSREIKMFPDKYLGSSYDTSIYVDANMVIYGELSELTKYLSEEKTFAVSRHAERNNVKEEIEACVNLIGVDKDMADKQYERYLREGFRDDQPLLECGCLVRRHDNQALRQLMQAWFEEFRGGIRRDQLSLMPCVSRLRFEGLSVMDGNVWHNQFFKVQRHKVG